MIRIGSLLLTLLLFPGAYHLMHGQSLDRQGYGRTRDYSNFIRISGESNINSFSFNYDKAGNYGSRPYAISDSGDVIISIPIKDFRASNPLMYNDFLMITKESEYPMIRISFPQDQLNTGPETSHSSLSGIRITIAGVTRTYKIDCSIVSFPGNLFIRGQKTLKFTDFNINPPVKLSGLVKVSDEIDVDFGFMINFTTSVPLSTKL